MRRIVRWLDVGEIPGRSALTYALTVGITLLCPLAVGAQPPVSGDAIHDNARGAGRPFHNQRGPAICCLRVLFRRYPSGAESDTPERGPLLLQEPWSEGHSGLPELDSSNPGVSVGVMKTTKKSTGPF